MCIILLVARDAVAGCALVLWKTIRPHGGMAGFTFHFTVLAKQGETRQVVVEIRWQPAFWGVAGIAVLTKPPLMRLICGMAGSAVCGCAHEDSFPRLARLVVAVIALDCLVLAHQRIIRRGMVIGGWQPVLAGVACRTIRAELICMWILSRMAGTAFLGLDFQIR